MMSKFMLFGLILSQGLMAQEISEDAIILNQELQFLEESANNVSISRAQKPQSRGDEAETSEETSLESKYFGTSDSDAVGTKAAAPKRRRSY